MAGSAVETTLRICTLNLHGFNNSKLYLQDLCKNNDIVCIQEHWLTSPQLLKFNDVHEDFSFYGCSAMDNVCAKGLLRGRPFGGVGFLFRKSLSAKINFAGFHCDSRVISMSLTCNSSNILLFCVYLPCDDGSQYYCDSLKDIFGFIESVTECYPGYKSILLGDFNFQCNVSVRGFKEFLPIMNNLALKLCDDLDSNCVGYTYAHNTLDHRSLIDHVFVNSDLLPTISGYRIVSDANNLSDHLPVLFSMSFTGLAQLYGHVSSKKSLYEFRWDKGDLTNYYHCSGNMLSRINHCFGCIDNDAFCDQHSCEMDIDVYYSEIVHCLTEACKHSVPRIPVSALKHYWSSALDDLKHESVTTHNLWKSVGCPRYGNIFDLMKDAKSCAFSPR